MIAVRLLEEDVMFVVTLNGMHENEVKRTISASNAMLGCALPTVSKNFILYKDLMLYP